MSSRAGDGIASVARKVLFFQHSGGLGGAPRSLHQIVKAYEAEFGPQTVLFIRRGPVLDTYRDLSSTVGYARRLQPFHGSEGAPAVGRTALRNILGLLFIPWGYYRYLRGYKVLYLNSSALCFYGLFAKLMQPATRVVVHLREPLLPNRWGDLIRWAIRHSADHILAISNNELEKMGQSRVPTEVVYNYVYSSQYDVQRGNSMHRISGSVGSDKFVVGYFARVNIENGIQDFIRLARDFESDDRIEFCIYGYEGNEGHRVRAAMSGIGPNVRVYPMVNDVPRNLCDIDVLVVPFQVPHFSRSVIEAAMLGVPAIVYDLDSLRETVRHDVTGFVVEPGNVTAIRDHISRMQEDPMLHRRLRTGARQFALERFSERNYLRIRDVIENNVR